MNSFPVEGIPPSSFFSKTVYLDSHFAITAPEMPFAATLVNALSKWGFTEVFSDGEQVENNTSHGIHTGTIGDRSTIGDRDRLQQAERFYASFQRYAESLFEQVEKKKKLNIDLIAENVKSACDFARKGHRFLMLAQQDIKPVPDEDYLVSHTARSTIIAIIIGIFLKLPTHRLVELGIAALLHEIGMIKLPPQVYLSSRSLTEQERKLVYAHTVLGYNLLRSFNFPLPISVAALEHHERDNGTGYPRQLAGNKISLYAKIIAVACSYEAISSQRPHKEAKDSYTGMVELLKNEGKQYDDTIVRALVLSLSVYPIGLYVQLSNGKNGQVVDINPENPRYPIVQIFADTTYEGKSETVKTSPDDLYILRVLTERELG